MRAPAYAFALSVLLLAGCPPAPLDVPCGANSDCLELSDGVCLPVESGQQWCAYPDGRCDSGRRFSDFDVEPMYSGECVPEQRPGGPASRCDPTKEFDPPTPVPGLNSLSRELEFSMTSDELFALITRSAAVAEPTILTTTRLSTADDFPPPAEDPAFAPIVAGEGKEYQPRLLSDGFFLYYVRVNPSPTLWVSQRATRNSVFDAGIQVFMEQSPLIQFNEIQPSRDGSTLYFTRGTNLRSAKVGVSSNQFETERQLSSVVMNNVVLSADELTAYYTDGQLNGIYRTTRASKDDQFGPGQLIPSFGTTSFALPRFVSEDHCSLYVISEMTQTNYDIWVARRPQ